MKRTVILPASLVAMGIALAIGCIPVPTSKKYQVDGLPRPERAIGTAPGVPVRLGETTIADAFVELSRRVRSRHLSSGLFYGRPRETHRPEWSITVWQVSADRRQFALSYTVRTLTWVMPLCFATHPVSQERWLVLDVDPQGVVTGARTTDFPPLPPTGSAAWLTVFDPPTRQRLREAGVLPTDEALEAAGRAEQQRRRRRQRRAAGSGTTTSPG